MNEPENLVLQQLREIRAIQDRQGDILHGILTRLSGIEQLVIMVVGLHKDTDIRMTRLEARVERLEKQAEFIKP